MCTSLWVTHKASQMGKATHTIYKVVMNTLSIDKVSPLNRSTV